MVVPAWTTITDAQVAAEAPITTSLMTALRDNVLAAFGGASGAPTIGGSTFDIGGSGVDGAAVDATVLTGVGYFDFSSVVWTSAHNCPSASIIRVIGNFTLSGVLTVGNPSDTELDLGALMVIARGNDGIVGTGAGASGGGGGCAGAGGNGGGATTIGAGGAARAFSTMNRPWLARSPIVGGRGGLYSASAGRPGGSLILIVKGNVTLTAGTINANGTTGFNSNGGGGGGGSIIIISTGAILGGTLNANGGAGDTLGSGGGGGFIHLIAPSIAGVGTTVGGGGGAAAGSTGTVSTTILTAPQINGLLARL